VSYLGFLCNRIAGKRYRQLSLILEEDEIGQGTFKYLNSTPQMENGSGDQQYFKISIYVIGCDIIEIYVRIVRNPNVGK
jgi:hypothetical protein